MDNTDLNLISRQLVEAFFGLSPQGRLSSYQKRTYPRLFNATRRLMEIYMDRHGLALEGGAAHLSREEIERVAGIRYTNPAPAPKVAPKAEQSIDDYIGQLLAEVDPNEVLTDVVKNILDEPISEAIKARLFKPLQPSEFKPRQVKDVVKNILDEPIPDAVKARLLEPLRNIY